MKNTLILLGCVCLASGVVFGEEAELSVKAEVDKAVFTIGERVEYKVTVTHDPSVEILSPVTPAPSDLFDVKEVHDFREKEGSQIVEGRRMILTTYELGEFILEPVTIRYRSKKGEEKEIQTNRLYLTVESVDASGKPKTDIRGMKDVLGLRARWVGTLAGFLLLLLGGVALYLWRRHRRRSGGEEKAEGPALSPEDEALLRLARLFDSDLIRRGKIKEYYLELSQIVRCYLERRFNILAVESTTSEILFALGRQEISSSFLEKLRETLQTADLVKFAKWKPSPSEIVHTNQLCKRVIEEARPKPPAPEVTSASTPHGV